jgi:nucleotide-binding universal stress UspA family protein
VSEEERRLRVRRILLALDAASLDPSVMVEAVQLAARFRAELLSLFVEDADLFRLAGTSSVRAVDPLSAAYRDVDSREIERLLRVRASRMRRSLAMLAERLEVSASFRVTRGRVASVVLTEAEKADVLVLDRSSWALVKSRRLSPATRTVLSASPVSTLILRPGSRVELSVLVVHDGSPLADRALVAAVTLAERYDGRLTVLVLGDGMERAARLRSYIERHLEGHELQTRYRLLTESNVPKIASIVRMAGGGTLVLPARGSVLHDEALVGLLNEVDVPVLLVR